jgi:hypothetical protein
MATTLIHNAAVHGLGVRGSARPTHSATPNEGVYPLAVCHPACNLSSAVRLDDLRFSRRYISPPPNQDDKSL